MLAGEERGDVGGLAVRVALPFRLADLSNGHALAYNFLFYGKRLQGGALPIRVEVFVQAVDEEVEELLCVLLPVHAPFLVQTRAKVTKGRRPHGHDVVLPHAPDQVRVDFGHDAVAAFPIFLHKVAPTVVEEERREWNGCEETLDRGIHIASYTKVDEASTRKFEVGGNGAGVIEGEALAFGS